MDEDMQYACEVIRTTVSPMEAGKALGLNPHSDGRCKCPFHGGDRRNLKLYGVGRGYYCFVCHASGDVINLVKEYSKVSFVEAVEWISDAFDLHLSFRKDTPWRRIRRAEAYARRARERGEPDATRKSG